MTRYLSVRSWMALALGALVAASAAACSSDSTGPSGVSIAASGGNNQVGAAGVALATPLTVVVKDVAQRPVASRTITWTVTAGGGSLSAAASTTDQNGVAAVSFTLGSSGPQTAQAALAGASGSPVRFSASIGGAGGGSIAVAATVPIPANYGIHDTFVRDGLAFVSAWDTGLIIYDVGNGVKGGSPTAPVEVGRVVTSAHNTTGSKPSVHNAWWFHNPVTSEKRYVFVGEEGPGNIGVASSGDIHVVDVSNMAAPVEVAFFHLPAPAPPGTDSAGTHNFWMDEPAQILYAAYYNGGVVALDVSGTLSGDLSSRLIANLRPGGAGDTYVWGVQLYNGDLYASDMLSGLWRLRLDPAAHSFSVTGGGNNVADRFTSDLWVANGYAYTGTWGGRSASAGGLTYGNALKVWQVGGGAPVLKDSVIISGIRTVSDDEVSADGKYLLATTEQGLDAAKGLYIYGLANPAKPAFLGFVSVPGSANNGAGLHTGTFATINGRRYVFAARNPGSGVAPALMIFDVTAVAP